MTNQFSEQYRRMMEKQGLRRYTRLCAENPKYELERYGRPGSYADWRECEPLPPIEIKTHFETRKDIAA